MGTTKDIVPALIGFAVSLVGIYVIVRVASGAWASGQK
jgi:hypothetical protein